MTHRTTAFLATLALALAPATAAFAKPVSTYSVTIDWNSVYSASISQTEAGVGTFSLTNNTFDLITCADGSTGLVTNTWSAMDSPATVSLAIADRKMTAATATASGSVDLSSFDSCTGVTTERQVPVTLVFDATATGPIDRSHASNGDRVISRSANVVVSFAGTTAPTGGHIVETISK